MPFVMQRRCQRRPAKVEYLSCVLHSSASASGRVCSQAARLPTVMRGRWLFPPCCLTYELTMACKEHAVGAVSLSAPVASKCDSVARTWPAGKPANPQNTAAVKYVSCEGSLQLLLQITLEVTNWCACHCICIIRSSPDALVLK